jgi:hypothetical protein
VIAALFRRVTARGGGHVKRSPELTKAFHFMRNWLWRTPLRRAVRPNSARQTDAPFSCGVDDGNLATTHIDSLLFTSFALPLAF